MRLFDLSLRYKMPLWGGGLIIATAIALSTSIAVQAWENLNHDLRTSAEDLGRLMARSLFPVILHDDVWGAFEIVSQPFASNPETEVMQSLIVLDSDKRVYVSSRPQDHPVLSQLVSLGPDFAALDRELPMTANAGIFVRDIRDAQHIYVAVPITNDHVRLGTLIVSYDKSLLWRRFSLLMKGALWMTLLVLGVLLPISAYWGRRMMRPMQWITGRIRQIGEANTPAVDPALYPYKDEVGLLYQAYADMHAKLLEKAVFEKEMVKSERMAAVGRLTASIAHEINNPLGGMLNAISTLKRHGDPDPVTQKTISLLERGLSQIKETVAALLVEAKVKSRPLSASDFDDVRVLVAHASKKQSTQMTWTVDVADDVPLPSTLVRQVLMNLLLNAIAAAGSKGQVSLRAHANAAKLVVVVENTGQPMLPAQLARLFEPFTSFSENGNGLGLWICYQIVTQLGGTIQAESDVHQSRFTVVIPLSSLHETIEKQNLPD